MAQAELNLRYCDVVSEIDGVVTSRNINPGNNVQPGQSLWAVAEAYDPDADTRLVIADIEQMNSMTGDQLQPGETLWVPRG